MYVCNQSCPKYGQKVIFMLHLGMMLLLSCCSAAVVDREQQWHPGYPEAPVTFLLIALLGLAAWFMAPKMHPNEWEYPLLNQCLFFSLNC